MPDFRSFGEAPSPACDAIVEGGVWRVPEEIPVSFVYNRRNYAVMLATPSDFEDFAVGFSLSERIVDDVSEIDAVDIHRSERGVEFHLFIAPSRLERFDVRQQRRNLAGRAGCGLCGLENAEQFFEKLAPVADATTTIDESALVKAEKLLPSFQKLNAQTRTVHAAAWADAEGEIQSTREDVGRHNALDKLLGGLALAQADFQNGFVIISSRCSYEIVEKAARLGVRAITSLSAPTAFALRKAAEANISLYAREGKRFVRVMI